MKGAIVFLFMVWVCLTVSAQAPWLQRPDSLKKVLENTTDDDLRIRLISTLFVRYVWSSPDSAVPYAQQYMLLAQKKKSNTMLATAYGNHQVLAQLTGNFPQALEYGFKALSIAERTKSNFSISSAYVGISEIYLAQGDNERCIQYAHKGLDILNKIYSLPAERPTHDNDTSNLHASISYTISKAYVKIGLPDSILKYIKVTEWIWGHQWVTKRKWPTIPLTYGNVNYIMRDYVTANRYFREGVASSEYWDTRIDLMENLNGLAKSHSKMNHWDSAIYYARKVLGVSKTARNPIIKMEALTFLANAFKAKNNIDSSAKYFELTLATKDSMFNQSRIVEMQNSTFNEQLRQQELEDAETQRTFRYQLYSFSAGLVVLIMISFVLYRNMQIKQKAKEKVEKAFGELKAAQTQLIQSEKMASLGELTAGIAHEIQNPLNFVNNFSEVNKELLSEMKEEIEKGNLEEAKSLATNAIDNQEKINEHGKRADAIVKGMLQHSRSSSGVKEPTNINVLADEYLKFAYHGFRAKDKSFNVTLKTNFDEGLDSIIVVPQDIGRVILNLLNNAFYAVSEKRKTAVDYEAVVSLSTRKSGDKALISVNDNGIGISSKVLDKIFQPFFTTKPTGQGTGLGLSLSYDIVKAHGGQLAFETTEGEKTIFTITLPFST